MAFETTATNLSVLDTDPGFDVYVDNGTIPYGLRLASRSATGQKANGISRRPALSADGNRVAFETTATNLTPLDTDSLRDIVVKDHAGTAAAELNGAVTLVSVTKAGIKGNGLSRNPSISNDGTRVAFLSESTNLDPRDTDTKPDVYVKNLGTGDLALASVTANGIKSNEYSAGPVLAAGGLAVAFGNGGTNLDPRDSDITQDIYVKNLVTGELKLASVNAAGLKGDAKSSDPAISGDGTLVAFATDAANLDPRDHEVSEETSSSVYLRNLVTNSLTLVSPLVAWDPALSADGTYLSFGSPDSLVDPLDIGADQRVYVANIAGGVIGPLWTPPKELVDEETGNAVMSADGTRLAFSSISSDSSAKPAGYRDPEFAGVRKELTGRPGLGTVNPPPTSSAVSATATAPYITLLFGRSNWATPKAGTGCNGTIAPNVITLKDVADYLNTFTPKIPAIGNLTPARALSGSARFCKGRSVYANWNDVALLHAAPYNWQFVSAGQTYTQTRVFLDRKDQDGFENESCGSLDDMEAHGLGDDLTGRTTGMYAFPNNDRGGTDRFDSGKSPAEIVATCFSFGRKYDNTQKTVNVRSQVVFPWAAKTVSLHGGPCKHSIGVTTECPQNKRYLPPAEIKKLFARTSAPQLQSDTWFIFQAYRFRTGSGADGAKAYDCTSADPYQHYTVQQEEYCWEDYKKVIDDLRAVTPAPKFLDPACVALTWSKNPKIPAGTTC